MSNTLTGLLPDIYEALDVVSREVTGFIPAVSRSSSVERLAIGQKAEVVIAPEAEAADTTPGVTAPDTGDQTIGSVGVAITKSRHVPVRFNGEETKGLMNAGTFTNIRADRFYQAMRALVNEIEMDVYMEAYRSASRAYGTAATTPFANAGDLTDFSGTLQILEENGAPTNDLQMVLGSAGMGNLRGKQSTLFKVNEAGSSDMLRNGMTDRIMNFAIRQSAAVKVHTKGTGTGYQMSSAAAQGSALLPVDTGSGTLIGGDVITLAGDSSKYVANSDLSGGNVTIGGPGILANVADNAAMTIGNSYTPNVAFSRSALVLATRAPALPEGGDAATDRVMVTDPVTNITFEIARYAQFRQVVYHVAIAWGQKGIKPAHTAILMG